jgi:hypothetical protein
MFTQRKKKQKRTIKPGNAFENTALEQWFENGRGCSLEKLLFTYM